MATKLGKQITIYGVLLEGEPVRAVEAHSRIEAMLYVLEKQMTCHALNAHDLYSLQKEGIEVESAIEVGPESQGPLFTPQKG